jgi:predicted phage terminase large subunit-like protein
MPSPCNDQMSAPVQPKLPRNIRRDAHRRLTDFARAIAVPGRPASEDADEPRFAIVETALAPHHTLLLETCERAVNTPHGRVMILMPPGSAKSTYCSVVLPAFLMGRDPGTRIILASYGTDLARKHGRRARAIVRSPHYQRIFNTTLSREQSAADGFALTNGSEYMATGIQSAVIGNRANGLIIDDPVKGRDEADSALIRARTREGYEDDLKTRLVPGGWIILVQTRWHEDDLAGSILPEGWAGESGPIRCRDGAIWDVLCLPARADRLDDPLGRKVGDYLWPEWFDREHWDQFERIARTWSALYQQKPAPETGDIFEASWLKTYERGPDFNAWCETLTVYGASDYAVTDGGGDYTVHVVAGVDRAGRIYVLDLWRAQTAANVWAEAFCDLVTRWKPIAWAEEAGQIRSGVGPFLAARQGERGAYVARREFPARGDKTARARAITGRMALDGLYLPAGAPWVPALRAELLAFPHGRHDDQVDALGLIGQLLEVMRNAGCEGRPAPRSEPV